MGTMFEALFSSAGLISLITLVVMEIVLGVDNVIFIAILTGKLPKEQQAKARAIGLSLALIMRIGLLFTIKWIMSLNRTLLTIWSIGLTGRDLVLLAGGLFLLYKSVMEILDKLQGVEEAAPKIKVLNFKMAVIQIVLIDIVFSFDSILTAVGLVDNLLIMILAVIISLFIMLLFSKYVSDFVNNHPTVKMLALCFLLMIGVLLVAEGFHCHLSKATIYFAMGFSFMVELLNLRLRDKRI
jgi:predicted tellurium resistance membrane protein TerC